MIGEISVFAALFAGLLSFVTPCVLPLVPPYLGFMAGATLDQAQGGTLVARVARRRMLTVAAAFVLGFSTVFVLLGAAASALGSILRDYLPELSIAAGVVIIIMGAHFLGVFRIPFLYRELRFEARKVQAGPVGAYFLGLAFAFGWTPCIGPVLSTILGVAATRDTVGEGALLLFIYSMGMGIPFVLAALFAGPFLAFMQRFRAWMPWVERAMGALLIATGILFVSGGMQAISGWLLRTVPNVSIG